MKGALRFRRTTLLIAGCTAVLAGLGFARLRLVPAEALAVIAALLVLLTMRKRSLPALMCVVLLGFSLGWLRGAQYLDHLRGYDDLANQKVVVAVRAETDGVYDDRGQLAFDATDIEVVEPEPMSLVGRIKVAGYGEPMVYRGDIVRVEGKLFATRGSRQASIGFAEMNVVGRSDSVIEELRRRFQAGMQSALPEPLASFGLGLLVGQRNTLPEVVALQLSMVGLTHVVFFGNTRYRQAKLFEYRGDILPFISFLLLEIGT